MFSRKALTLALIGIALLGASMLIFRKTWAAPLQWHMVNVNYSPAQGDANLLITGIGRAIMIDVGDQRTAQEALIPYLQHSNIAKLDMVFVSHAHKDHYGGLITLLENGIKIGKVFFNTPPKESCDKEIPWGCDFHDIQQTKQRLKESGVDVLPAKQGMNFILGFRSSLKILYALDIENSPFGPSIDINDTSLIMRLEHGPSSALFTGDLNAAFGGYLSENGSGLKASILKVPHHGTESVAPNAFFDSVAAEVSLVPAPLLLWCSERSNRIRNWHRNAKILTYVNGAHGHVVVLFGQRKFTIFSENSTIGADAQALCPIEHS